MWTPRTPEAYIERWALQPDGESISTPSSTLTPVLHRGRAAMLKVAHVEEEGRGCRVLAWWNGRGAARVWEADDHAAVMERGAGPSLRTLSEQGDDDAATRTLCHIAETLHDASALMTPPSGLMPLREWFRQLFMRAESHPREHSGAWQQAADLADGLLADEVQEVVLHGDLHHDNVLDFGGKWKAIDPKSVIGNRLFDYTSLLFNPSPAVADRHFDRRIATICHTTSAPARTVLEWTLASATLSASWFAGEERTSESEQLLRVGRRASVALREL